MNKKAVWRIIEATFAILLITGTIFFFLSKEEASKEREDAFTQLRPILDEIAKNSALREKIILDTPANSDAENNIMKVLEQRIKNLALAYNVTICDAFTAAVCDTTKVYPSDIKGDIYSEERLIAATLTNFNSKIIKLYLWEK